MRPKFIALIAVSALALVGCGAAESTQNVAVSPSEAVAKSPVTENMEPAIPETPNPTEVAEEKFFNYAKSRSIVHSAPEPARDEIIESLHSYCESGEPIEASKVDSLNENLEHGADTDYCEPFESK